MGRTRRAPADREPRPTARRQAKSAPARRTHVASASDVEVEHVVSEACRAAGTVILAVSGGRDSMALLHAAAAVSRAHVAAVATFDHGTGAAARAAAALVSAEAAALGLPCVAGRAPADLRSTEAAWRTARWRFLRMVANRHGAAVVTAHTLDDQAETVLIRILRHAGARGLAGLDVDGEVVRPWLATRRAAIERYAARRGIAYVDDPSNVSRAFLRNRVRLDLLPALRRVRPTVEHDLLAIGRAAASWRRAIERVVTDAHPVRLDADGMSVAVTPLIRYDAASLAVVWPVLAARGGLTLDRRGTARLAEFTRAARVGAMMQLSGGFDVQRTRFSFVVRRHGVGQRGRGPEMAGGRPAGFGAG